jgi:hypothetical protein
MFQNMLELTDDEWEYRISIMKDLFDRFDNLRELTESIEYDLDRDDSISLSNLLILHDRINSLITVALDSRIVVNSHDEIVTYDDWDAFTRPAVSQDEIVVSASEYDRDLDLAYSDGVDDAWDKAENNGIDMGIVLAARVLRVLGATIKAPDELRD